MRLMSNNLIRLGIILVLTGFPHIAKSESVVPIKEDQYKTFYRIAHSPIMRLSKWRAWKKVVPEITKISITSTADGTNQPALFYSSNSPHKRPLLLVLHSWSADYKQHYSIPYGIWAVNNDWIFMHPNYRGAYTNPQSTASEVAIEDILDALEYAKKHANVDDSRIYITGFSGGAMTTLIMISRYPDIWAGAAAWVPVYNLVQWYQTTKNSRHNYSKHIANSCSGPPLPGTAAEAECHKRSVSTYLKNIRGKNIPVYIATGIRDGFVSPGHSLQAFNDLAEKNDRISSKDINYINTYQKLPPHFSGIYSDTFYSDVGLPLLYEKKSSNVTLKIFNGKHDIIYNASLFWLSQQTK